MQPEFVRAGVALLFALLLFWQARGAAASPQRKRGYELASGSLLAFAGFNVSLAFAPDPQWPQLLLAVLGVALFVGAVIMLFRSFTGTEGRQEGARFNEEMRRFREEREARREKK